MQFSMVAVTWVNFAALNSFLPSIYNNNNNKVSDWNKKETKSVLKKPIFKKYLKRISEINWELITAFEPHEHWYISAEVPYS